MSVGSNAPSLSTSSRDSQASAGASPAGILVGCWICVVSVLASGPSFADSLPDVLMGGEPVERRHPVVHDDISEIGVDSAEADRRTLMREIARRGALAYRGRRRSYSFASLH